MSKPPAFQFYAKDWLSSRTVRTMSAEDRGIYIDLLAMAWDSEEPGTLILPLPGYNPRTVRSFLLRWPSTFVSSGVEKNPNLTPTRPERDLNLTPTEAERRLKSGRKDAEIGLKFTNLKLQKQWEKMMQFQEKASDRGKKGANARWYRNHASSIKQAMLSDGSAFAFASASASSNTTFSQDAEAEEVSTEAAAAIKSVFDILQTNPFGSLSFKKIFVEQSKNGAKSWVDVMEHTIQACKSRNVAIPGRFYKIKHVLEKLDAADSFRRTPL